MRPLRPPEITAAGVLLIVAGSVLIAAYLGVVAMLAYQWGLVQDGGTCCASIVLGFIPFVGLTFLGGGIAALSGTLEDPTSTGRWALVVGGFLAGPSLLSIGYFVFVLPSQTVTVSDLPYLGSMVCLWAMTAVLLTAGWLLRRNTDRFREWQTQLLRRERTEDDGYEAEEEA